MCREEAGASEMRPYQDDMVDLHPALSSPSATPLRSGGYADKVKRADDAVRRMRGETRRKARRCIHRRSIAARIAAKTTGTAAQGAGGRPRPRAPRQTPEGAKRGHGSGRLAERTEAGGGELRRTATRRHICICRAVARTRKSPALHREYRYPNRGRTLTGKPARHRVRLGSNRVKRVGSTRVRAKAARQG